jgi:hypothetical protein
MPEVLARQPSNPMCAPILHFAVLAKVTVLNPNNQRKNCEPQERELLPLTFSFGEQRGIIERISLPLPYLSV